MKKLILTMVAVILGAIIFLGSSRHPGTRIGTNDSRAIAVAYGNSSEGMEYVKGLFADIKKAKDAKSDSLVKVAEQRARTFQILSHLLAFSTGSVSEILERHKSEVDAVAKEAGVDLIVSKFELNYAGPGIDTVDVTPQLVRMFKPSERVKQWLAGMAGQKPLPMLETLMIPPEE